MIVPDLARAIVPEQPAPPRHVPAMRLWLSVLRSRAALWLQGFGVASVLVGASTASGAETGGRPALVFGLGMAGLGLFTAVVPTVFWIRLLRALSGAPLGQAEVRDVQIQQQSQKTVDATHNGFAEGVWIVSAADGRSFEERFEIDEPFARQLRGGSRVDVLVDARRAKSLFHLGLVGDRRRVAAR